MMMEKRGDVQDGGESTYHSSQATARELVPTAAV